MALPLCPTIPVCTPDLCFVCPYILDSYAVHTLPSRFPHRLLHVMFCQRANKESHRQVLSLTKILFTLLWKHELNQIHLKQRKLIAREPAVEKHCSFSASGSLFKRYCVYPGPGTGLRRLYSYSSGLHRSPGICRGSPENGSPFSAQTSLPAAD